MKIKLQNIQGLVPVYPKLKTQTLPLKLSYKLTKFFNAADVELKFMQDRYKEIIDKYTQKDENGNILFDEHGNRIYIGDFSKEVQDLLNLEVDMPDIMFKLEELENIQLSLEEFEVLFPFIQE